MTTGTRILATGLAVMATLVGGASALAAEPPANSISVTGEGHARVTATGASFSAGVSATATTARLALTQTSKRMRAIRASLLKAGVAAADLTTGSVSTYRRDKRHAVAQQTLDVKVEQVARTGRLITIANRAGASSLNGPEFTYGSSDAAYQQALVAALANAHAKAVTIATAVQGTIDGTISVVEGNVDSGIYQPLSGAIAAPAQTRTTTVPIKAPASTVDASVVVTYSFR